MTTRNLLSRLLYPVLAALLITSCAALLLVSLLYVTAGALFRQPRHLFGWQIPLPVVDKFDPVPYLPFPGGSAPTPYDQPGNIPGRLLLAQVELL